MNARHRFTIAVLAALCVFALAGCGTAVQPPATEPPAEQPPAASAPPSAESTNLYDEIKAADYTQWTPAPGYDSPQAAKGPHGEQVQVLLDPTAEKALADGGGTWPVGSIIAKDIYTSGSVTQIAAMKKTADGWYWGEWDTEGTPAAEGLAIEPCQGCHAKGTDGTLGVQLK